MMKLGICEWVTPIKGPAIFQRLKELGIDGIQLDDWDGSAQNNPLCDPYVQKLYSEAAKKSGVACIGMAGNALGREGGMLFSPETERGKQCWSTFAAALDACDAMRIPVYLAPAFFAGFPRTQAERKSIVKRLKEACDYAAKTEVCVALESIFSAEELLSIWDEIAAPNFGIYYDTQNPVTYAGIDVAADLRKIGPGKIVQIHVKDGVNCVQGSVHLGCGETRFEEAAQAIRDIGYDGWIVLENYYSRPCFQSDYRDPWDRIAKDVEIAKRTFDIS